MWEFLTDTTEWWSVSCVLVKWLAGKIDMTTAHNYVDGRPCQLEQSTFAYDAVKEAINWEKKLSDISIRWSNLSINSVWIHFIFFSKLMASLSSFWESRCKVWDFVYDLLHLSGEMCKVRSVELIKWHLSIFLSFDYSQHSQWGSLKWDPQQECLLPPSPLPPPSFNPRQICELNIGRPCERKGGGGQVFKLTSS